MSTTFFRVLRTLGALLFIAAVFATLLFAEGYQFDRSSKEFVKKSVIIFEGLDAEAGPGGSLPSVSLDGEAVSVSFPGELRVSAGNHALLIEMPRFYPFRKEFSVLEDSVELVRPIKLLPETLRSPVSLFPIRDLTAAGISDNGVWFISEALHFAKHIRFAGIPDAEITELPIRARIKKIAGSPGGEVLLALEDSGRIFWYDPETSKISVIPDVRARDIVYKNGRFFYLTEPLHGSGAIFELDSEDNSGRLFLNPAGNPFSMRQASYSSGRFLFLFEAQGGSRSLVVTNSDGFIEFQLENADSAFLEEDRLIFSSGPSLQIYDFRKKKLEQAPVFPNHISWFSRIGGSINFLFLTESGALFFCDEDAENCHPISDAPVAAVFASPDSTEFFIYQGGILKLLDFEERRIVPEFLQSFVSAIFGEKAGRGIF